MTYLVLFLDLYFKNPKISIDQSIRWYCYVKTKQTEITYYAGHFKFLPFTMRAIGLVCSQIGTTSTFEDYIDFIMFFLIYLSSGEGRMGHDYLFFLLFCKKVIRKF